MAPGLSEYELQRQKNLEENRRILLGIRQEQQHIIESMQPKPKVKPAKPKKAPQPKQSDDENGEPNNSNRRKSARLSGKKLKSWKNEDNGQSDDDEDFVDSNESEYSDEEEHFYSKKKKRGSRPTKSASAGPKPKIVVPKNRANFYGAVPGIPIGKIWETRMECCADGVHRPTVAGIHAGPEGAYSISLSGGYEDDLDLGDCFTYTGEGGRALKGKDGTKNLRTAPQSKDQTLTKGNLALSLNVETRKPVRVIRGYKLRNKFAPEYGYRYDGLYTVEKYWSCPGKSGFQVYKFALNRCPDQPPTPWSPDFIPPVDVPVDAANPILEDQDEDSQPAPTVLKVKLFNKKN